MIAISKHQNTSCNMIITLDYETERKVI